MIFTPDNVLRLVAASRIRTELQPIQVWRGRGPGGDIWQQITAEVDEELGACVSRWDDLVAALGKNSGDEASWHQLLEVAETLIRWRLRHDAT